MKIIKNPGLLLIVILLIASFFRFYEIAKLPPGFYPDEAMYVNNGVEAWETGHFKVFYPENYGREGLWPNIIGFFAVKFGHEPWIPRSVAAIFGILTVLGVYFLTKELFKNKIALIASFFLATSFWHINFSRIAFRAILAPFFLVWTIYFLLKSLNLILRTSDVVNIKNKVQLTGLCLLGGIFYGLGFYTYIAYRATPILILIILFSYWFKNKEKIFRRRFLLFAFLFSFSAFIVATPLGLYFLKNPQDFFGRTTQISIFNSPTPIKDLGINILKTAGMFNFAGDQNWRHNYPGRPELFWPVGILFLIGVFLAVKALIQNLKFKIQNYNLKFKNNSNMPPQADTKILHFAFCILISWLTIAALPVIISNEGQPHALRAILMAPPVFILAGIGGLWLYELLKNAITQDGTITCDSIAKIKMLNIFVFIFLSLLIFEAYNTYFIKWGQNPNAYAAFSANYVEIGRQLNALPKEIPKYVVVKAPGVEVRGIPMPAQTVMFITDTFTPEKQKEKNIFYLLLEQINQIPKNSFKVNLE